MRQTRSHHHENIHKHFNCHFNTQLPSAVDNTTWKTPLSRKRAKTSFSLIWPGDIIVLDLIRTQRSRTRNRLSIHIYIYRVRDLYVWERERETLCVWVCVNHRHRTGKTKQVIHDASLPQGIHSKQGMHNPHRCLKHIRKQNGSIKEKAKLRIKIEFREENTNGSTNTARFFWFNSPRRNPNSLFLVVGHQHTEGPFFFPLISRGCIKPLNFWVPPFGVYRTLLLLQCRGTSLSLFGAWSALGVHLFLAPR